MAARLLLVAAALGDRLADGLAIGDGRRLALDRDLVPAFQPLDDDAQMHLAMARKQGFAGILLVLHDDRGILLDQALQGGGKLDLVLALLRPERDREHRFGRRQLGQPRNACLGRAQRVAGLHLVELAERHGLAGLGGSELGLVLAEHPVDARDLAAAVAFGPQLLAVGDGAGEDAGDRQLAAMRGVDGLHDLDDGAAAVLERRAAPWSPRRRAHRGGSPSAGAARHCPFRRCRSAPASPRRPAGRPPDRRTPRRAAARSRRAAAPSAGRHGRPASPASRTAPRSRAPSRRRGSR